GEPVERDQPSTNAASALVGARRRPMAARIGRRPGCFALRPPALIVAREPGTPGILALAKRRPLVLAPTRIGPMPVETPILLRLRLTRAPPGRRMLWLQRMCFLLVPFDVRRCVCAGEGVRSYMIYGSFLPPCPARPGPVHA